MTIHELRHLFSRPLVIVVSTACVTVVGVAQQPAQPPDRAALDRQAEINSRPDTLGTGRFPAMKEEVASLPRHVVYRPKDLASFGAVKLGVVAWGNGGCSEDGASSRFHLLEIASHGYLVIASGRILSGPGAPPREQRPAAQPGQIPPPRTQASDLTEAIGWALAENKRAGSPYFGRIDPALVAYSGWSCGGLQALQVAKDPRVKTMVLHNTGVLNDGPGAIPGMDVRKEVLQTLHTPVIYILGGPKDIAYANGMDDFKRIAHVPVAVANLPVGHGGTFNEPNGGAAASVAVSWLDWQLRGDAQSGRRFVGEDCGLCKDTQWSLERKQFPTTLAAQSGSPRSWWAPGQGTPLADLATYGNERGQLGVLNESGQVNTKGHPFFEPIGTNGRACVTCHQPADAMSLSVRSIRERWAASGSKDPLFAAIDGMNCPNLPPDDPRSHSLLLERGLIRVSLPWPPKRADGTRIDPEFTIEVVRDPSGCNSDPIYGLQSANPSISVFRRPRPVANTKYTTHQNFGVSPFIGKNGMPAATDPLTGKPTSMNLMSDARAPTLAVQAEDAARSHLQIAGSLTPAQLARIVEFERQVYVAQVASTTAGSLVESDGPPAFGPRNLAAGDAGVLGNNTTRYVFPLGGKWTHLPRTSDEAENARQAARESIARGHDVFMFRTFWIKDSMHLNSVGLGNPTKRTCATCHGMHMTGMDTANGWMDIGTTNLPWASEVPLNPWNEAKPQMPLFRVTCKPTVKEHPFLGRVIYTQDPGRALISGQCNDVGTIVMQQFRGLAARAPYFSNGSAGTLRELVDFYDRRYNIGYSEQEKQDLVNFLGAL